MKTNEDVAFPFRKTKEFTIKYSQGNDRSETYNLRPSVRMGNRAAKDIAIITSWGDGNPGGWTKRPNAINLRLTDVVSNNLRQINKGGI